MTTYLCIDSALGTGSVALYKDSELLEFQEIPEKGAQAKFLVSTIQSCLEAQNLEPQQVDTIYCTVGPGGFTGIRIALASAQAYGFTLDIPVVGVSTLACAAVEQIPSPSGGGLGRGRPSQNSALDAPLLASPLWGEEYINPLIPAGKGKAYTQSFSFPDITPLGPPELVALEQKLEKPHIDARSIGKLMVLDSFNEHHALPPDPLYIRPPDAVPQKLSV